MSGHLVMYIGLGIIAVSIAGLAITNIVCTAGKRKRAEGLVGENKKIKLKEHEDGQYE